MVVEERPIVSAIRIVTVVRHSDEICDADLVPFFPGTNVGSQSFDFSFERLLFVRSDLHGRCPVCLLLAYECEGSAKILRKR